ncbi:hypothetical protein L9F63_018196 [Diploptera punctata]|uniref:Carboxylic ester hydrolase n=1 Tax=Diploptera punctata TaxID=6984 RepID=A0AAD8EFI0_DIPPU|nr:hypothetical protein L9F63_018196 [Diploptera punctata]
MICSITYPGSLFKPVGGTYSHKMTDNTKNISKLRIFVCIILNVSYLNFSECSNNLVVEVQQGKLQGMSLTSLRSQNEYFGFMGIPYAKPPTGKLRFKAPQPARSWPGILNATKEGNICIQMSFLNPVLEGKEDCLFINVYTPQLPNSGNITKVMPVMVWIHGGTFNSGSGNRLMQGPDYLVDDGVVVVTFNYRLGALGFLSLESKEVPGNAGMKDQVMALKWVQQNIAKFGGDPMNVTIFGQSAGGASVYYHMLSPMSEGLFQKAISQSGSVLCPWAYTRTARRAAFQLGAALGKNTTSDDVLLDFLRGLAPEKIVQGVKGNLLPEEERDPLGFSLPFVPTKEGVYEDGEEVFLPGTCSHEGYLIYYVSELSDVTLDDLSADPSQLVLPAIYSRNDKNKTLEIGNSIKSFYFGYNNISNDTLQDFIKLTTDLYFKYPIYNTAKLHASVSTSPVFMYQFAFDGQYGYGKSSLGFEGMPAEGAMHGEELGYLFAVEYLTECGFPISKFRRFKDARRSLWRNVGELQASRPRPITRIKLLHDHLTNSGRESLKNHNSFLIDNELSLLV